VSPEFARLWSKQEVAEATDGVKEIVHPERGAIEFDLVSLSHLEA
jgi:hypothetical protein